MNIPENHPEPPSAAKTSAWTFMFGDGGRRDLLALLAFTACSYVLSLKTDLFDAINAFSREHEDWQVDEIFATAMLASLGLVLYSYGRTRATMRELSRRIAAEERAREMAMHDGLTGLPNRRHLHIAMAKRMEQPTNEFAVVGVDLDRFKPVNDLYGHAVGDALLVAVAARLKAHAGPEGFVARQGGDEFVVLKPGLSGEALNQWLTELVAIFDAPLNAAGQDVSVGVTLGVALAPLHGGDSETLLSAADAALYRGKHEGGSRFTLFESEMEKRSRDRAEFNNDLRAAMRDNLIEPYFQPLVQLDGGAVYEYEILARWTHARRGVVPPEHFIRMAEEEGLIGELTLNVLRKACREANGWAGQPRLALNLSPLQLTDARLPHRLLEVLRECDFAPERLTVEVPEAALTGEFRVLHDILLSLKRAGVGVSLEDIGVSYLGLRLRELPVDLLKIDRSFVLTMQDNPESKTLVLALLSLAQNLGAKVSAEGIETPQQAAALRAIGCQLGQGFHFGKAFSGRDIRARLAAGVAIGQPRVALG